MVFLIASSILFILSNAACESKDGYVTNSARSGSIHSDRAYTQESCKAKCSGSNYFTFGCSSDPRCICGNSNAVAFESLSMANNNLQTIGAGCLKTYKCVCMDLSGAWSCSNTPYGWDIVFKQTENSCYGSFYISFPNRLRRLGSYRTTGTEICTTRARQRVCRNIQTNGHHISDLPVVGSCRRTRPWNKCANQGEECACPGEIRYASGTYLTSPEDVAAMTLMDYVYPQPVTCEKECYCRDTAPLDCSSYVHHNRCPMDGDYCLVYANENEDRNCNQVCWRAFLRCAVGWSSTSTNMCNNPNTNHMVGCNDNFDTDQNYLCNCMLYME